MPTTNKTINHSPRRSGHRGNPERPEDDGHPAPRRRVVVHPGHAIALIQSRIDAANVVAAARASWLAATATYQALSAHVDEGRDGPSSSTCSTPSARTACCWRTSASSLRKVTLLTVEQEAAGRSETRRHENRQEHPEQEGEVEDPRSARRPGPAAGSDRPRDDDDPDDPTVHLVVTEAPAPAPTPTEPPKS